MPALSGRLLAHHLAWECRSLSLRYSLPCGPHSPTPLHTPLPLCPSSQGTTKGASILNLRPPRFRRRRCAAPPAACRPSLLAACRTVQPTPRPRRPPPHGAPTLQALSPPTRSEGPSGAAGAWCLAHHRGSRPSDHERQGKEGGRGAPRPLCLSASEAIAHRIACHRSRTDAGWALGVAASERSGLRRRGVMVLGSSLF